jgi:FMN reductase
VTSIVVVSAGLSVPSSTRLLADRLAAAVGEVGLDTLADARYSTSDALADARYSTKSIELRELAHELADHLLTGFPAERLAAAIDAVRRADGLIVVTPVFSASYSGLFKMFFDVLEEGTLDGTPVLVAATGGTARHSLVLDHALRPLFSYLHAVVVPTGVFAATEDFGSPGLESRIRRAAGELVALAAGSPTSSTRRRTVEDEFREPTPFEELLRQSGAA